ncbi:MAG: nucleoside triphosphate pyrophosphatase [Rhodospirillales bacterium]|nr:nucleoside triphosphate pyrophosphatase [Rhodospirillales bacterium]
MTTSDFILASGSPQRKALLEKVGYVPKKIAPADIDESVHQYEKPVAYVKRMAKEKALKSAQDNPNENILAGDTVVCVGQKILHKSRNDDEQREVMQLLSGRACKVISAVCVIRRDGKMGQKCVSSRVVTKKLSRQEIDDYVNGHEWVGCCGYKIEGSFEAFVRQIVGSYSGIVGLPLFETVNLLKGMGIK